MHGNLGRHLHHILSHLWAPVGDTRVPATADYTLFRTLGVRLIRSNTSVALKIGDQASEGELTEAQSHLKHA